MKIKKRDVIKILLIMIVGLIVAIYLYSTKNNLLFVFQSTILVSFFLYIIFFSKDYMNPFIFFFIYSFLGFLDVILVVLGARKVNPVYSISIYNKTLLIMILWFLFFSIGYFVYGKIKCKNFKNKERLTKEKEFTIQLNVIYTFVAIIVVFVVYKVFTFVLSTGGIKEAFLSSSKIFANQNYLSMLMALCGILPVLYLSKNNYKKTIFSVIFVFALMSLTKRRSLAIIYSLLPVVVYYNYKVKRININNLFVCLIPIMCYVLFIGQIRGVSSGVSSNVDNALLKQLSQLTRQVEYGRNIPDLISAIDNNKIEYQKFKYTMNGILTYIPRSIWPNKPQVESAGIVSDLIYDAKNSAGHPVGPYGWGYLSFGYIGVVVMAFLNGLIVSAFYKYVRKKDNTIGYLMYAYTIIKLLEIFTPEAQFKVSFFIIILFILAKISQKGEIKRKC